MTKYRIIEGSYLNGDLWYEPQFRFLFLWLPIGDRHSVENPVRYETLAGAKMAINRNKAWANRKKRIIIP